MVKYEMLDVDGNVLTKDDLLELTTPPTDGGPGDGLLAILGYINDAGYDATSFVAGMLVASRGGFQLEAVDEGDE